MADLGLLAAVVAARHRGECGLLGKALEVGRGQALGLPSKFDQVDLESLAERSEGLSPADLKALCQEAALAAMARSGEDGTPSVCPQDFDEALARYGRSRESLATGV